MRLMIQLFIMVSLPLSWLRAETIVCDGVLGNSGEQGRTLVRFGSPGSSLKGAIGGGAAAGIGVVCDRFGSLWDRGGDGALNCYACDGRLLAQYRIPGGIGRSDQILLVGDLLVLQLSNKIYTLPVSAPVGTEVKSLGRDSGCISFGSVNGEFVSGSKGALFLVSPESGQVKEVAKVADVSFVDVGADGVVYAVAGGKLHKFMGGQEIVDGWPRANAGERPQLIDGFWYGHAWHGTIRRFNAEMEPAPGVVLGGSSGSFIGHLDQNGELSNGRGLARLRDNLYAVSGFSGTMHLMEWNATRQQFAIIRRIGAVPYCKGLGLDRAGNVWWHYGSWKWMDKPDTPIENGINGPEMIGQAVMLDNDEMVAPAWMWGKPSFYYGKLTEELRVERVESGCGMSKDLAGSVVYRNQDKLILLSIDSNGDGRAFAIGDDGKYRGESGVIGLKTAAPVKEFTSLAMKNVSTLLAGGDGSVIEFSADGSDWKESRRWSSCGDDHGDKFGAKVFISADAGRLWVSDVQRHRVVALDLLTCKPLASFGSEDKPGTDLASLAYPETLAARGNRAVVYDSGNQRLVKLSLK